MSQILFGLKIPKNSHCARPTLSMHWRPLRPPMLGLSRSRFFFVPAHEIFNLWFYDKKLRLSYFRGQYSPIDIIIWQSFLIEPFLQKFYSLFLKIGLSRRSFFFVTAHEIFNLWFDDKKLRLAYFRGQSPYPSLLDFWKIKFEKSRFKELDF